MNRIFLNRAAILRFLGALAGTLLFCVGVNLFIVPMNFYNGGIVGIAQILRTLAVSYLHLSLPFDLAGILVYLINIPLFILAFHSIGRGFFLRTLVCVTFQSLCLSLLPIPAQPLVEDPLTACLVGGLISGYGIGLTLRYGSSNGGTDILGMYFTARNRHFSVGKLALWVNIAVYGVCALLFDLRVVIYSLIYTAVQSLFIDKAHLQNINTQVLIFIKHRGDELARAIMEEMGRGVTTWDGQGAYTGEPCRILYVVISKYQLHELRQIVSRFDEKAFVSTQDNIQVSDNFIKRL